MPNRCRVFVGSSSEGLSVAEAVQANLDHSCEIVLWNQGLFGLGQGTLATLLKKAKEFDFAILVVVGEDMVESRGKRSQSPRDNVLLEAGIFLGTLGSERTFIVYDRAKKIKIPTDLAGIQHASYEPFADHNMRAAVGAACTEIKEAMRKAGFNSNARHADTAPNLPYQLHHISLPVRNSADLTDSLVFYRDVLCLEHSRSRPPFNFGGEWLILPSGQHLHLVESSSGTFRNSSVIDPRDTHFALSVRSFSEAIVWLDSKGVTMLIEPYLVGSLQLYILDPNQHVVEIRQEQA
jgi:catechol 2,3-dioxygenase-like lactoylglutathione lyase family enzyme